MNLIIRNLIIFCAIYTIMPLLFIKKDNQEKLTDNSIIVFKFTDNIRKIMLWCSIIMFVITIIGIIAFSNQDGSIVFTIIFGIFSILILGFYLFARNKKVIYQNNSLCVYNMFGKKKTFNISDIKKAVEYPTNGMELIFKDNSKIRLDIQLTNYGRIKDILSSNGITYVDKNNNENVKGWYYGKTIFIF